MITASCSGGNGDIVYSIPIMRELGVQKVYLFDQFYDMMHRLVEHAGFETERFTVQPVVDYNMDSFRQQPRRNKNHIMLSMRNQFGLPHKEYEPWLKVEPREINFEYSVIHLTPRWRENSKVDWGRVWSSIHGRSFFIGLEQEWKSFCDNYGIAYWLPTNDIYEMAKVISGAQRVYCNQSVSLALAQAMGKEYYCDFKPTKTNTKLYIPQEHEL